MAVVKNKIDMTNEAVAQAVLEANPDLAARYTNEDGEVNYDALTAGVTASAHTLNEFVNTLANVVAVQWTYDLWRGKLSWYDIFEKAPELYGDAIELIVPLPPTVVKEGTYTNPYDQSIPKTQFESGYLRTGIDWQVPLRISVDVMRGAFLKPYGLRDVTGVMVKNMYDAIEMRKYREFTADILNSITKTYEVTPITGTGETQKARDLYEEMLYLTSKMSLPSTQYNEKGLETYTPKGRFVLIWNSRVKSSIDVNTYMSLFKAEKLPFIEQIEVDFGEGNEDVQAVILDDEAYVNIPRIEVMLDNVNSATMEIIYFLHYWTRHGLIPWRQAVKLVANA